MSMGLECKREWNTTPRPVQAVRSDNENTGSRQSIPLARPKESISRGWRLSIDNEMSSPTSFSTLCSIATQPAAAAASAAYRQPKNSKSPAYQYFVRFVAVNELRLVRRSQFRSTGQAGRQAGWLVSLFCINYAARWALQHHDDDATAGTADDGDGKVDRVLLAQKIVLTSPASFVFLSLSLLLSFDTPVREPHRCVLRRRTAEPETLEENEDHQFLPPGGSLPCPADPWKPLFSFALRQSSI